MTRACLVLVLGVSLLAALVGCNGADGPEEVAQTEPQTATVAPTEPQDQSELDIELAPTSTPTATPTPDPARPKFTNTLTYAPAEPHDLWFTFEKALLNSPDEGRTWNPVTSTRVTSDGLVYFMAFPQPEQFMMAGPLVLQQSSDGGETWSRVESMPEDTITHGLTADPTDPETLYLLEHQETVHVSRDGGQSWEALESNLPPFAYGLWPVRAEPLRLLTDDREAQAVMVSEDGGATWAPLEPEGLEGELLQASLAADGTVYAATSTGLYASSDAGDTWESRSDLPIAASVAVHPEDSERIVVIVPGGAVFRSNDGGRSWVEPDYTPTPVRTPTPADTPTPAGDPGMDA